MIKSESLRKEFGLKEDDKVVLYSGNLGEKQGLDDIIKAAMYFILRKDGIHTSGERKRKGKIGKCR